MNWEQYLHEEQPGKPVTFQTFIAVLKEHYSGLTLEFAAEESGADAATIVQVAREIGRAGHAFAAHIWRNAAREIWADGRSRALEFLSVLVGAVGTSGGTSPAAFNKFIPAPPMMPPAPNVWNELTWPREFPLAFFEMRFPAPAFPQTRTQSPCTLRGSTTPSGLIPTG